MDQQTETQTVDACPECHSISNVVHNAKYKMKYKCNWCGSRFSTPAQLTLSYPKAANKITKPYKEQYWFDRD